MALDRRKSRLARAALGFAFALVVLYLVEVALRIAGFGPAYEAGASGSWRMTPHLDGRPLQGPRDAHSFRVSTNDEGLRTTLPRARTEGVARVAIMGDSTVFGWGVDDGGTVAEGLQAGLDAARPGAAEVLNAGQPGYSTTQVAWLFEEVVADWRPDRTVVLVSMHDANLVLVSDRELLDGGATLAARARVAIVSRSRIYQVLRQSLWPLTDRPMLLPDQHTGEPRVRRVSDDERTLALDAMRARAAEWGGEVLVGFLPFLADLERGPGDRPALPWAHAYVAANGGGLVDVRGCCRGRALVLPDDPGHLTAAGNRQAGFAAAAPVAASLGWTAGASGP